MNEQELISVGICPKCRLEFFTKLKDGTCPKCHGTVLQKAPDDYRTYRIYEQKRLDRPDREDK